jgi:malonyl-CoA O-methyltransferase
VSASPPPVQLDLAQVRRRFARAAAAPEDYEAYEKASVLQQEVARRMLERLEYLRLAPGLVIDAGCGTGHALKGLLGRFPDARLLAVDTALTMLARARYAAGASAVPAWMRRWLSSGPVQPVAADFDRLPLPDSSIGCIWSNLALHWAADPSATFAEWRRVLVTEGLVLFSTLGPDTLKELRTAWGEAGGAHVHPFIDMHDVGDMLVHAGFADPVMDMETITLTYRDLDGLFADLRATGSTNAHVARSRGLAGKDAWRTMRAAYEAMRRDGALPATFEIIYGHAWKPQPRPGRDGVAVVRVEDIGRGGRGRR